VTGEGRHREEMRGRQEEKRRGKHTMRTGGLSPQSSRTSKLGRQLQQGPSSRPLPPCCAAPSGRCSDGGSGGLNDTASAAPRIAGSGWGGQGGGGNTPPQVPRCGDSGVEHRDPFAPRQHNPRRPPSGACSAVGPPLSDVVRHRSGELAQAARRTPGTAATWGVGGSKGWAATHPWRRGASRPNRVKRGHSRHSPTAQPGEGL
jgi:hypothetical protein